MYAHINFAIFVHNALLKMILAGIIYAVGVVKSPGKLIKISPTVIRVKCISAFYSHILATILP